MRALTREEGLARLDEFVAKAGRYAAMRSYDGGAGNHAHVSRLSPYLRHRLIQEEEVVQAVLDRHAYGVVEKFLQEVAWRTYWKGWLEMRPLVWRRYQEDVASLALTDDYAVACAGRTGVECFDAWAVELIETGYLHNHARMWFASIWIFTLRLPWQLGADFMLRHLRDGDPASNTLSWRWVAGLHTKGKHYLARAENIAKYTNGRFNPRGQLEESAPALAEEVVFSREPLHLPVWRKPRGRIGHWMMVDDLGPPPCPVDATAGWHPRDADGLGPVVSPVVHAGRAQAVEDAARRAGGEVMDGDWQESVHRWMDEHALDAIVMAHPTVGPWRDVVERLASSVPVTTFARPWDAALWPYATAGFFRFRERLPGFFQPCTARGASGEQGGE
jgi:deoxyribodipyrimidine photo-lyase